MSGQGDNREQVTVAADQVLSSVSSELRALTEMSEQLQFDISDFLKEHNDARSLKVYQLQNLDHITQILSGLAAFMDAISDGVPKDWSMDAAKAAQKIPLADLSSRLSHGNDDEAKPSHETDSGDCSFF